MMKRILIFAVVLSLLVPAAAFAATEFSLGGYVKLDTYWDSTQNNKNIGVVVGRNNDPSFHHGNMRFTADGSRFNFTIKGPDVLGAKLTGFIEMDFEETADQPSSASNAYIPRLRHAMFRLNWPGDTELIFGQYWSMFCDYFAEAAEDGTFQVTGTPTARLPQIRFTQGFLGDWHVAALVGQANNDIGIFTGDPYAAASAVAGFNGPNNNGGAAETPQIQGQIKYQHDWWGKAAFYGHPMPFTASVTAGWQRNIARDGDLATVGLNGQGVGAIFLHNTYVSPWMVQASLFIPVIPTHTDNLAGTAHIIIQPWIGQGVNAYGMAGDATNVFKTRTSFFNSVLSNVDAELLKRYGIMAEAQYYFTNQWYINAAYGVTAAYDINQSLVHVPPTAAVPLYSYNSVDQIRSMQQVDATLWWRPIAALKFGVQYAYAHSQFLLDKFPNGTLPPGNNGQLTNKGDEHRVEFVGFFYF
jgi:opacity protein-like surface antigen